MRTANRQSAVLRTIILSSGILPKSETNNGDDMADIAKKISKLDEKIGKLKERIKSDTAECEKLSEQKALLMTLTRKKCSVRLRYLRRMILTRIKNISNNKTFRAGVTTLQHLAIACRDI